DRTVHADADRSQLARQHRHADVDDVLGRSADRVGVRDLPDLLGCVARDQVAVDDARRDEWREGVGDERLPRVVHHDVLHAVDGADLIDEALDRRRVTGEQEIDGGARQASRDRGALGRELVRQVRSERPHGDPPGDRRQRHQRQGQEQDELREQTELQLGWLLHTFTAAAQSETGAHRPFTTLVKYTLSSPWWRSGPKLSGAPMPRSTFFSASSACRKPARVGLGPLRRSASTITLALTKPSRLRKLSCSWVCCGSRNPGGSCGLCLSIRVRYSTTANRLRSS